MKTFSSLAALLTIGCLAAFWFAGALPAKNSPPLASSPKNVSAHCRIVRATGYVEPASEVRNLTFNADGVVESCPLQVGQVVEAGDTLATLANHDEKAAQAVAQQQLAVAQAERAKLLSGVHPREIEAAERRVALLQEEVRHAATQCERQSRLVKQKAGTEEAFDQAKTHLEQAKEALAEAEANRDRLRTSVRAEDVALADARVQLSEANLLAANERLRDTVLNAPMHGTVLEILKREGEAVRAFDHRPAIVFANLSELRVRVEVDERYVSLIHLGQEATVYGRSLGNQRAAGKVVNIKSLMGDKTVFTRDAAERKDLDVLQVMVDLPIGFTAPIGLQVDVDISIHEEP